MEKLKGKIALITGAGKGLGRAIALALAEQGVHLALISRTQADLQALAESAESYGVKAAYVAADVANYDQITQAVAQLREQLGPIDILINNAGIGAFGSFMELPVNRWEEIIQVNLMGAYYTARAVFQEMMDRNTGDIVNVASTAGLKGGASSSAYSASKAAVIALSESMMQEGRKHNIRVNTMLPSTVATDLAKNLNLTDGNPEKVMQAEDFAQLIVLQLQLPRRVFVKESQIWSTNP